MTVKYVFWDSDNTLVDTATHHWKKHAETLLRYGITLDNAYENRIYTNNGAQNWEWLSAELGLSISKEQYLDEIDSWYFRHIDEIGLRTGIHEALHMLDAAGIPMGVVSNGRKRSVLSALNARNLSPRFQFILCIEDYEGRKPEPGPYLAAKLKMQQITGRPISGEECLVIEDDPKGVEAGRAAGMYVLHRPIGDNDIPSFLENIRNYILPQS